MLLEAAQRLLARHDYESVSVAMIAKVADCSVGAFYGRFQDKDSFLKYVVSSTFRTATNNVSRQLATGASPRRPLKDTARHIVEYVAEQLTAPKMAGVTRAALKLGTSHPEAMEPLNEYRAAVAAGAVNLIRSKRRVPAAIQMMLATIFDSLTQDAGPLRAGGSRMVRALEESMVAYIEYSDKDRADDDEPETIRRGRDLGTDEPPELNEGEIAIYDPDLGTYHGKLDASQKRASRKQTLRKTDSEKSKPKSSSGETRKVDVAKIPIPSDSDRTDEPIAATKRPRRRFI
jgi:AcrR family transcriptional regulator